MYKAGDRFIIEIEEVFTGKATGYPQYRIKGFDKLVMDDRGLVKLSKYEDKQKQDAEIKVGDEVIDKRDNTKAVILDVDIDGGYWIYDENGCASTINPCEVTKSGRTFSQIAEMLKEMRGEDE